jgi:hypothetical protein
MLVGEPAAPPPDRGPYRIDDHCLGHAPTLPLCDAGRVELRAPVPDGDPYDGAEEGAWAAGGGTAPDDEVPAGPATWRVDRRLTIAKIAGAGIFALAAVIGYPDAGQVGLAGLAAVLLAVLAVRDLIAPVRLAADSTGVTVATGFAGRRQIGWDSVERVRVDARRGLVVRSQVLELDAGDNLYFFSVHELGAPCDEVARRLAVLRS